MRGTACTAGRTSTALKPPAPEGPPIMVCGTSFPLVRGVHGNGLRSRCSYIEDHVGMVRNKALAPSFMQGSYKGRG
jgi:hypothetical protein